MDPDLLEILREAVKTCQRKEELERSIGRALRGHDRDFRVYVEMMSELRDLAKKDGIPIDAAAAKLLEGQEKDRQKSQSYDDSNNEHNEGDLLV